MAEIVIPMRYFRQMVQELGGTVFESGEAVAIAYGHHLLRADKSTRTRRFRGSIPMLAIGYSGVAKWEMSEMRSNGRKRR